MLLFIDYIVYTIGSNEHFSPRSAHASTRAGTHGDVAPISYLALVRDSSGEGCAKRISAGISGIGLFQIKSRIFLKQTAKT